MYWLEIEKKAASDTVRRQLAKVIDNDTTARNSCLCNNCVFRGNSLLSISCCDLSVSWATRELLQCPCEPISILLPRDTDKSIRWRRSAMAGTRSGRLFGECGGGGGAFVLIKKLWFHPGASALSLVCVITMKSHVALGLECKHDPSHLPSRKPSLPILRKLQAKQAPSS